MVFATPDAAGFDKIVLISFRIPDPLGIYPDVAWITGGNHSYSPGIFRAFFNFNLCNSLRKWSDSKDKKENRNLHGKMMV